MTGKVLTAATARAMRADRAAGMTLLQLAVKYEVAITTVQRHMSETAAAKFRQWDKDRFERVKADPEKLAKHRARKATYARNYRQK